MDSTKQSAHDILRKTSSFADVRVATINGKDGCRSTGNALILYAAMRAWAAITHRWLIKGKGSGSAVQTPRGRMGGGARRFASVHRDLARGAGAGGLDTRRGRARRRAPYARVDLARRPEADTQENVSLVPAPDGSATRPRIAEGGETNLDRTLELRPLGCGSASRRSRPSRNRIRARRYERIARRCGPQRARVYRSAPRRGSSVYTLYTDGSVPVDNPPAPDAPDENESHRIVRTESTPRSIRSYRIRRSGP